MTTPPAPPQPPAPPAPAPSPGGGGGATILAVAMIGIGGYLAWFAVHYWRSSSVAWPSDPVKAILQGKPLPSNTAATTAEATLTSYETTLAATSAAGTGAGEGSGGSAGGASAGPGENSFFSAVLSDLGAPATAKNIFSLMAWARKEEPGFPPQSVGGFAWNPLNIKNANTGAFQTWSDPSAGAHGTAAFMLQNNYSAIVSAFRAGNGLCGDSAVSSELSAWSGGGYSSVC